MRPSPLWNRRILIGVLTGVLVLPSPVWAGGHGPDKGDDHPSNQRGSGAPEWASQGPPPWAMNQSAPPPWAASACDMADREACRAQAEVLREQVRAERRALKEQVRAERRALREAEREARELTRHDADEPADADL